MRRVVFMLGVGAVTLGIVGLFLPGTVQVTEPDAIIVVAGFAAVTAAIIIANRGISEPRYESDPPAVESPGYIPLAGDDVDELLRYASPPNGYIRERRKLRRRTQDLAVNVLETFNGYSTTEADEAISEGSWTNDRVAAAFFGVLPENRGIRDKVWYQLFGPRSFDFRFMRALAAITAHVPGRQAVEELDDDRTRISLAAPHAGVSALTSDVGETGHWRGVSLVALGAIGLGVLAEMATLLLGGVVGIAYVAYSRAGSPPSVDLAIERTLSPESPEPGEPVTVRVTVENRGGYLADIRLIDGVPRALTVVEGSARRSASLRPGQSTTLAYSVTTAQGTHTWSPLIAIARSINGTYEHRVELESDTTLTAKPISAEINESIPLRPHGNIAIGQLESTRSGEGVEFQSVREYRPGDRRSRIDWRRYARFGELTTVEFREERATSVVLAVDGRADAYLRQGADEPSMVEIAAASADRLAVTLLAAGHRVALASLSPDPCWLAPSAERAQHARINELIATHPSFDHLPPEGDIRVFAWVNWFRSRIPDDAQVLLLSPLCDDTITEIIVRIEARGHPVTIISPDPTTDRTAGSRMVALERSIRIAQLRRRGITVVDWATEQALDAQLMQLAGRWPR